MSTCLTTINFTRTHTTQRRTHTVLRVSRVTEPGKLNGLLTQVGWRHSYHRQQWQDAKTRRQHARTRWQRVRACKTHTHTHAQTHTSLRWQKTHCMLPTVQYTYINKALHTHSSHHIIYYHIWVCFHVYILKNTWTHTVAKKVKINRASGNYCHQQQPHKHINAHTHMHAHTLRLKTFVFI